MLQSLRRNKSLDVRAAESLTLELLKDKITPTQELPRVARTRLMDKLGESVAACNCTVITGRAGTGKTMLTRDYARSCGRRLAWYKVDASDADLSLFFQYLCASIASQRPGFGRKTLERVGERVSPEHVPLLVEYFVYELLERDEPLLIVLDDLHLVYDAEWVVPFFRRLLPLLPREVHVVIIGRSQPPAPLWRMRSKQTLCVLEEDALSFTDEEAVTLYESYGLPGRMAAAAAAQTRGRAAQLDARARASRIEEGAEKAAAERGAGRRASAAPRRARRRPSPPPLRFSTRARARQAARRARASARRLRRPSGGQPVTLVERYGLLVRERERVLFEHAEGLLRPHSPERRGRLAPADDDDVNLPRQKRQESAEERHDPFGVVDEMQVV
jgi:hypothetical protein